MPVVSSLHSVLLPLRIKQNGDAIGSNINEIVSEITFNILKEQPSLVAISPQEGAMRRYWRKR